MTAGTARPGARVVVAMSGGVDSSVAAALLVEQGFQVIGVTLQLWPAHLPLEHEGGCCSLAAVEDARRVANRIGIPYYVLNFEELFEDHVIRPFVQAYSAGRTPNPCIVCNEQVKFGALLARALELDADYLATGHYARVTWDPVEGRYALCRAADPRKDQSYALYGLTQEQLARTLFPLGPYTKVAVRQMAAERGLPVAAKPDSQELCFVGGGDYREFLRRYAPESLRPGEIVDLEGRVLGRHQGVALYTVGQRRGLGVAGRDGEPLYVLRLEPETNRVVVGTREQVGSVELRAGRVNWVAWPGPPAGERAVTARVRSHAPEAPAVVAGEGEGVRTRFLDPQPGVAPGQSVVWYDGDRVAGGGIIEEVRRVADDQAGIRGAPARAY